MKCYKNFDLNSDNIIGMNIFIVCNIIINNSKERIKFKDLIPNKSKEELNKIFLGRVVPTEDEVKYILNLSKLTYTQLLSDIGENSRVFGLRVYSTLNDNFDSPYIFSDIRNIQTDLMCIGFIYPSQKILDKIKFLSPKRIYDYTNDLVRPIIEYNKYQKYKGMIIDEE